MKKVSLPLPVSSSSKHRRSRENMKFNSRHDDDGGRKLIRQNQPNRSLLHRFRAAVKKITVRITPFGNKSKGNTLEKNHDYDHKNSTKIRRNSSVFSFGSRRSSQSRSSFSTDSQRSKSGAVYGSMDFTLEDIKKATNNFSQDNIIGRGSIGTIYRGQLRSGSLVAIKRVRKDLFNKRGVLEFKNEILAFSNIQHLNLVRFYGYLEHPDEKLIVVEYVSNGTLFGHLHGSHRSLLELGERLDIAIDVAHAVTYLHSYNDPPIIHRDIKASNVLITNNLRAKVADFGFARLVTDEMDVTHISTQIKGTLGYLDPEYMKTYKLTKKSDVYSFGILLVEIVTGRHPLESRKGIEEKVTVKWALRKLTEGMPVLAMDPKLNRSPASIRATEKVLQLSQRCTAPVHQSRPSMKECVEGLWTIRKEFKDNAGLK